MLNAKILANAVTTVFIVAYVLCGILAFFAPNFIFSVAGSWFHSINLEAVRTTKPMGLGTFIFGVVTFGAYIWIFAFAATTLYNQWSDEFRR